MTGLYTEDGSAAPEVEGRQGKVRPWTGTVQYRSQAHNTGVPPGHIFPRVAITFVGEAG